MAGKFAVLYGSNIEYDHSHPNIVSNISKYSLNNKTDYIFNERTSDSIKLLHISFDMSSKMDINTFRQYVKNGSFHVMINELSLSVIPIILMIDLYEIKQHGNTFVVKFPEFIFDELHIVCMFHTSLSFKINNVDASDITNISFYVKNINCSTEIRKKLMCPHYNIYQHVTTHSFNKFPNSLDQTYEIIYNNCNYTKGFFLEDNISNIKSIKIMIGGYEYKYYDNIMMDLYCKKISDGLIYIPFNDEFNYDEISTTSYIGSINTSVIHNINLHVTYYNIFPDHIAKIHSLTLYHISYRAANVSISPNLDLKTKLNMIMFNLSKTTTQHDAIDKRNRYHGFNYIVDR